MLILVLASMPIITLVEMLAIIPLRPAPIGRLDFFVAGFGYTSGYQDVASGWKASHCSALAQIDWSRSATKKI